MTVDRIQLLNELVTSEQPGSSQLEQAATGGVSVAGLRTFATPAAFVSEEQPLPVTARMNRQLHAKDIGRSSFFALVFIALPSWAAGKYWPPT